jgi:hypothetical protein
VLGLDSLASSSVCIFYFLDTPSLIIFLGLATYLIVRMWFEKAILDFNSNIALQGPSGPQLVAQSGNGFTSEPNSIIIVLSMLNSSVLVIWVGYAFYAVPLIISLDKLNVKATKDA